jgi:protein-S-isoprenylcysteine O-methyltransferase Ste14
VFYLVLGRLVWWADSSLPNAVLALPATAVYLAAIALRYWALHLLRHQWAVHVVDRSIGERTLISDGPYRFVRHPLYLGAIAEILALPVMFGSLPALLVAVIVFTPTEVHRAYFEEKQLLDIFKDDYPTYKRRTWAFFPLPFGKQKETS